MYGSLSTENQETSIYLGPIWNIGIIQEFHRNQFYFTEKTKEQENFPTIQLNSELCFLLISCEKYRVNLHASHEPIYISAKKIQEQVGS